MRPLIKALKRSSGNASNDAGEGEASSDHASPAVSRPIDPARLSQQVGRAQQLIADKPDDAVAALRQMLSPAETGGAA